MPHASELREWVALFLMDLAADGQGGFTEAIPASLAEDRPAKVEQLSGSEANAAEQTADRVSYKITIRYDTGITTAYRVYWRNMYLDITGIKNVDMRDEWLQLECIRREAGAQ